MKHPDTFVQTVLLLAILLVTSSCSSTVTTAPPEARSGDWLVKTTFGEFTLTVNDAGTAITKVYVKIDCNGLSGEAILAPSPWNIDEKGSFTVTSSTGGIENIVKGKFSSNAKMISGNWDVNGCSDNWDASR